MIAISRAEVRCVSTSSPHALSKCVCSMPSSFARSFIFWTNADSEPARCSAIATAASLPEATSMHLIISCTVCSSPASKKHCEPPIDAACSVTTTVSSSAISPRSNASKIKSNVMTFVTDAGRSISSAFFS